MRSAKLTCLLMFSCVVLGTSVNDVAGQVKREDPAPDAEREYDWPAELPTVAEVIARHVNASGGEAAIRRHTSRFVRGRVINDESGYRAILSGWQVAPNKLWLEFRQPAVGKQILVFDGEVGWVITPNGDKQLLFGRFLRDLSYSADFYPHLDWATRFESIEVEDFKWVSNAPCVRLKFMSHGGKAGYMCYNLDTGLHAATQTHRLGAAGQEEPILVTIAAYEKVSGVLVPSRILQQSVDGKSETVYTVIELTPKNMPNWTRPPEIAAQLAAVLAQKKAKEQDAGSDDSGESSEQESHD